MWPALAKQGTSRQRHPTDLRFNKHQCRLLWSVIINYNQYFQFVKVSRTCFWKKIISEPLIYSAYCIKTYILWLPFRVLSKECRQHDNYIAYTVGLNYLKPVRCRWRRLPCYARAGHIYRDFGTETHLGGFMSEGKICEKQSSKLETWFNQFYKAVT